MNEQLTFVHAADLHLGAPFRGLRGLSEAWAARLVQALTEAYDRLIDVALSRRVDFVVLAGDIFDNTHPSYNDYHHFFKGLMRLEKAGIEVYLVTGNHDPFTSWKNDLFSLPKNAHLIPADKPGFYLYERAGQAMCLIGGRGYFNQTWPADECIARGVTRSAALEALTPQHSCAEQAPFAVGILHTGLNLDRVKAPVDPAILMDAGMDYWALGHIHRRYAYPSFDNPCLVFSGCIQGRDINEVGERGVYVVTLTQGEPNRLEAIPCASVVWQKLSIDCSDCASIPAITEKIMRELFRENGQAHCEEMVSRITLRGQTALHDTLKSFEVIFDIRRHLNESYSPFFCDALIDKTVALRDKQALAEEGLFPSVLLRVADMQRTQPQELLTYLQNEFLSRKTLLSHVDLRDIDDLAEEAENLVLDLLAWEKDE